MGTPTNQNYPVPWLTVIQSIQDDLSKRIRCCLPGTISAVNGATVNVKIGVMQRTNQSQDIFYPELVGCPLMNLQAGGASGRVGVSFPATVGDECLVFFSDRAISNWLQNGAAQPLPNYRLHDISDGFVLLTHTSKAHTVDLALGATEGGIASHSAKVAVDGADGKVTVQVGTGGSYAQIILDPTTKKIRIQNQSKNLLIILSTLFNALYLDPGLNSGSKTALSNAVLSLGLLLY